MTLLKRILPVLSFFLFLAGSCKKDSSSSATGKEMLTDGKWQISDIHYIVSAGPIIFLNYTYDSLEACAKDDFVMFQSNGTILSDQGSLKCDPSAPQTSSGSHWSVSDDLKTLTITSDSTAPQVFHVLDLAADAARIAYDDSQYDSTMGITWTYHDTISLRNIR